MKSAGRNSIKRIMVAALLAALFGAWSTAVAQEPPAEDRAPPCDPATEVCDDALPEPEADSEPGAEEEDNLLDPDLEGGPQAAVEEDPAIEASADEVFTPGDEISEDYPIPLPSDI